MPATLRNAISAADGKPDLAEVFPGCVALLGSSIAELGEHLVGFNNGGISDPKLIGHEFTELGKAQVKLGVEKRGVERGDKLGWNGVWDLNALGDS